MDTKQSNPLTGIRTLAKDMARHGQSKIVNDSSSSELKSHKPVPKSAFVDDSEKSIYQAPSELKPVVHDKKREVEKTIIKNTDKKNDTATNALKSIAHEKLKPLKPIAPAKTSTEPAITVDNEDAATATIISDTKYNRFRLLPAITTSLKQWFSEIKEKYFTKKAPKYSVPETSRRKGVIQEATSNTGRLTTFDRTSLQERIRQRREKATPKEPTTTWSANTEPGFLLLEEPDEEEEPKISNVKVEPRKSFRTPPAPKPVDPMPVLPPQPKPVEPPPPPTPVIVPTIPEPPQVAVTPAVAPVTPPPPVVVSTAPETPIPTTTPTTVPVTPSLAPDLEESTIPVVRTLASEQTLHANNTERMRVTKDLQNQTVGITRLHPKNLRDWLFSLDTNIISFLVIGLLLVVSAMVVTGYFWFTNQSQKIALVTTPDYPTLLSVPLQTIYIENLTKDSLFSQIVQNQKQSKFSTLQIGLISSPSGETLLPATTILNLIDGNINPIFSHSVKAIYFGNTNQTTPFVVMKTTDLDVARGGLLTWESSLSADLEPFFLVSQPNLSTTTAEKRFSDLVVAGNDARVLTNEDGSEIIIYTLTKENILIITTNQKTLIELLTLIPKQP